ncbi:MAG: class I SAM-dependent methyltransferase [Phycisphaeraceae bacterium]
MRSIADQLLRASRAMNRAAIAWDRKRPLPENRVRPEFAKLPFAALAMQTLLDDYDFDTVLDVGAGEGLHAETLQRAGKSVTAVDYGRSPYFEKAGGEMPFIVADFNRHEFDRRFDCVWCSHVLEHQPNANRFLVKVRSVLEEGGVLALTVPPLKTQVVGGHLAMWTGGLLLYHLVVAGFDCREARLRRYGYNISVLLTKRTIDVNDRLVYDQGDIRRLREFLPERLRFEPNPQDDPFEGEIRAINW